MEDNEIDITRAKQAQKLLVEEMVNIVHSDPTYPIIFKDKQKRLLEYGYFSTKSLFRALGKNLNGGELDSADLSDPDVMVQVLLCGLKEVPENGCDNWVAEDVERLMLMKHFAYYAFCIRMAMEAAQPDFSVINRLMNETTKEKVNGTPPLPVTPISPISGPPVEFS